MTLRVVFMGTPDFSVPALRALKEAEHEIVAVYTQPSKPVGRGQKIHETPVHCAAGLMGIEVFTPKTLRDVAAQEVLRQMMPDIIVVAAYGLILPQAVLAIPKYGCLNIHASLLPRWRGAAPIQRAILAGDSESGITIMQMAAGLDTGDMLLKDRVAITDETTTESLHDALSAMGGRLIKTALELVECGGLKPEVQSEEGVTYAAKLEKGEGVVAWKEPAAVLARRVRALMPWPGVFFSHEGETIKILKAHICDGAGAAGTLLDDAFTIACGHGALRLELVQREGKKPAEGAAVLRGMHLDVGHCFA